MKKIQLFNINVIDGSYQQILAQCYKKIKKKKKCFIITLNSLMINKYVFNRSFQHAVKKADMIVPDGYGIILASRLFRRELKHQIPGIDLMYKILGLAYEKRLSVFLLGGSWPVVEQTYKNFTKWFPNIKFLGRYSGYLSPDEERRVIQGINKLQPDILLTAMGSPRQELWLAKNKDILEAKILIGLGGSFDVASGHKKRAPVKWREKHLEWLYRCLTSPSKWFNLIRVSFYLIIMLFYRVFKYK